MGIKKSLHSFIQLTRIEHAFMLAAAVFVGEIISPGRIARISFFFLSALAPFLIEVGSFAINDYFDVESDRKNKRLDRPLVRGDIKPRTAHFLSVTSFALGVLSAWFVNMTCFAIALVFAVLAYLYSYKLKDIPLLGNTYIALSMAIPFIYGNFAVYPSLTLTVAVLSLIAFLAGLGREITGDIRDLEGDKKRGSRTLPLLIGRRNSAVLAVALILLAVFISPLPYFMDPLFSDTYYLIPIALTDLLFVYSCSTILKDQSQKKLKEVRFWTLLALGTGLMGFLASALM